METYKFYENLINLTETKLCKNQRTRNIFTGLKLASFILTGFFLYKFAVAYSSFWLGAGIFTAILFIILTVLDNQLLNKITFLKSYLKRSLTELNYLKGDLSALPDGEEFIRPDHFYSFDLDIFGKNSLFCEINRTVTPEGTRTLAGWLENPCMDPEQISRRQLAAEELSRIPGWCLEFLAEGDIHKVGTADKSVLAAWKNEKNYFRRIWQKMFIYLANLSLALAVCAGLFTPLGWQWAIWIFFIQLAVVGIYSATLNKVHQRLGNFISAAGNYLYLVKRIESGKFSSAPLQQIREELFGRHHSLEAFRQLKKILDGFDSRGNLLMEFLLNGLYMRDLYLLLRISRWKNQYLPHVIPWINAVTKTDVYISMALYRFNHPDYCIPEIKEGEIVRARAAGHPLLHKKEMVANDFTLESLHRFFIVTGANMAGKSTFLRTIGVNLVLALSGNVTCARQFSCRPIRIFTSMRTTDNLTGGTSYFQAELLRLKALKDAACGGDPYFIILDEMLKGTNSRDKQSGSLKFLTQLTGMPLCGLVATHDLALGELAAALPAHFTNICFEIAHGPADEIIYDYKIKPGVSKNMNATLLMERMGLI